MPKKVAKEKMKNRPPIVAVLGHIDHGKTTLLDYIRKAKVASGEAGAITQHLGAYQVVSGEHTITFLDTPGHEAFVSVRGQGLKVADVALLVVAADDGVKAQTKEALTQIKAENVPYIVVLTKIDKPEAQVDKVKKQLSEIEVFIEEWGGDVPLCAVSSKSGQGIDDLLEMIGLMGELKGLAADANLAAEGVVLDSWRDAKRGVILSILVKNGSLHAGDVILADRDFGKVRRLEDFQGRVISVAGPSVPARVVGPKNTVKSGTSFRAMANMKAAEAVIAAMPNIVNSAKYQPKTSDAGETVYLVLKADQHGSLEAINYALKTFTTEATHYKVVRSAVGNISISDIEAAVPNSALILGFNVLILPEAENAAKHQSVVVRTYPVIYDLLDTVKAAIEGQLKAVLVRHEVASLKVLAIFKTTRRGMVVGCRVSDGLAKRGVKFDIMRGAEVVGQGRVSELRQEKEAVGSVAKGRDCGLAFEGNPLAQVGDMLTLYEERQEVPTLESLKNAQRTPASPNK